MKKTLHLKIVITAWCNYERTKGEKVSFSKDMPTVGTFKYFIINNYYY